MPGDPFDAAFEDQSDPFAAAFQTDLTPAEIEQRATTGSAKFVDSGRWKPIAQHAKEMGFTVVAAYDPTGKKHNKNSQHYTGDAVDIRTKDKTPEEVDAFIANMRSKGFYVRDERTKPKGQAVWTHPHVHVAVPRGVPLLEAARAGNPVLDAMMAGVDVTKPAQTPAAQKKPKSQPGWQIKGGDMSYDEAKRALDLMNGVQSKNAQVVGDAVNAMNSQDAALAQMQRLKAQRGQAIDTANRAFNDNPIQRIGDFLQNTVESGVQQNADLANAYATPLAEGIQKLAPEGLIRNKELVGKMFGGNVPMLEQGIKATLDNIDPAAMPAFIAGLTKKGGPKAIVGEYKGLLERIASADPEEARKAANEFGAQVIGFGGAALVGHAVHTLKGGIVPEASAGLQPKRMKFEKPTGEPINGVKPPVQPAEEFINASQVESPATVHGDVLQQPQGVPQVSRQSRGKGVRKNKDQGVAGQGEAQVASPAMAPGTKPVEREGRPMWSQPEAGRTSSVSPEDAIKKLYAENEPQYMGWEPPRPWILPDGTSIDASVLSNTHAGAVKMVIPQAKDIEGGLARGWVRVAEDGSLQVPIGASPASVQKGKAWAKDIFGDSRYYWEIVGEDGKRLHSGEGAGSFSAKWKEVNIPKSEAPKPTGNTVDPSVSSNPLETPPSAVPPKEPWQMTREEYHAQTTVSGGDPSTHNKWVVNVGGKEYTLPKSKYATASDAVDSLHKEEIAIALEGKRPKPVPPEVLADYPDLQAKYGETPPVGSVETPPVDSAAPQTDLPSDFGANNKLVTKAEYEELKKKLLEGGGFSGVDPEKMVALTRMGLYYIEGGIRTFAEWSAKMVSDFGEGVKQHLPEVWKQSHREMGVQEPLETGTTVAHADVDRVREWLGTDPRKGRGKPDAELQAEANELKPQALALAHKINDSVSFRGPGRLATDAEQIAIGMRLEERKIDLNAASKAGAEAALRNDAEGVAAATKAWNEAYDEAVVLADALDKAGSETGAALRARQFLLENQTDEFSITRRMEKSKDGKPLTPEERVTAQEWAKEDAKNAEAAKDAAQKEAEAKAQAVLDNEREDAPMPRGKSLEAIKARREWAAKAIREELAKAAASPVSMILGAGSGGGIAPDVLKFRIALREYAYTLVDEGIVHLEDVVKRITKDFPGLDRDKVISELASPTSDPQTRSEAALAKAKLIREAKQIKSAIEENKSSRLAAGKKIDDWTREMDRVEKRIKELEAMQAAGEQIVKTKDGKFKVPDLVQKYRDRKAELEKELTINVGAASKTKEARRLEDIQKQLDELNRKFANNDFRKKSKEEVKWSDARRQAEEKLKRRRAEYNEIIRSMEPKSTAQKVENFFSNAQLIAVKGRLKDAAGNTVKLGGETGLSQIRGAYMKPLEKLGDGSWTAMGVNPANGIKDLFDEPFKAAVDRRIDDAIHHRDAAMNAKWAKSGVGHAMAGVTDVPFAETYRRAYLAEWAAGEAKLAGMKGDKALMRDMIADAPQNILDEAEEWSRRMTYNNDNYAARLKRSLEGMFKQSRNDPNRRLVHWADTLGEIATLGLMRYGKVIQNVNLNRVRLMGAGLPEGLVKVAVASLDKARTGKTLTRAEALDISDALARGTVGSVGLALGYMAYKNGVKAPWFFGREMQTVDKNGNLSNSYWWDPGNAREIATGIPLAMMMGYEIAYSQGYTGPNKGQDMTQALLNVAAASVIDQPILTGNTRLIQNVKDDGVVMALLNQALSKVTPGVMREMAQDADSVPAYKDLGENWFYGLLFNRPVRTDGFVDSVKSRIPGARGYLPTKAQITGR